MPLPTLTTERLLLRERIVSDIPAYLAMDSDPLVMRYVGDGSVPDPVAHAVRIRQRIAEGSGNGVYVWSVFERDPPGGFLGCALLSPEPALRQIELAYRFNRGAWGRGFATEAGRACLAYGFRELGLGEIVALAYPENAASQRVLAKLGFKIIGEHAAYGTTLVLFTLAAADFS
ncbi:MAG TPA: GNAT family N-acetyltransferase [Dongiaceae bacterium]